MNTAFLKAWATTSAIEKGYVNNPNDSGGETNRGITIKLARAMGWTGPMRDLPEDVANDFAKRAFWDPMHLDEVAELYPRVAAELFDSGFLCGIAWASHWLQSELNRLNLRGHIFADILVDARIGAITLAALRSYAAYRGAQGELVLLRAINCAEGQYLGGLVDARSKDEDFYFGWLLKRVSL